MLQTQRLKEPAGQQLRETAKGRPMTTSRTMVFASVGQESALSAPASGHPLAPRQANSDGAWSRNVKAMLRDAGLRPTRQRIALGTLLFGKGDRHVTAEMLYEEASNANLPVSLATVYNALHQFTDLGLLRQVAVDGSKTYFDTNASLHHHFFVEGENALLDIPDSEVVLGRPPIPPEGYEIARIDVVVRLRRKSVIGNR
jgi:Fur family transcriptional regulator, iron response regulator